MDPALERKDQKDVETENNGSGRPNPHVGTARGVPPGNALAVFRRLKN